MSHHDTPHLRDESVVLPEEKGREVAVEVNGYHVVIRCVNAGSWVTYIDGRLGVAFVRRADGRFAERDESSGECVVRDDWTNIIVRNL